MPAIELAQSAPSLLRTPKGMRLGIALFGRRNVGKSSILNALVDQEVSIVSPVAGTTTDPVDKPMELLPLGPVLLIDTAGMDEGDDTLGALRLTRTQRVFDRCDVGILVTEAGEWGAFEEGLYEELSQRDIPVVIVFNKIDLAGETEAAAQERAESLLAGKGSDVPFLFMDARNGRGVDDLIAALIKVAPEGVFEQPKILGDLVPAKSVVVLVTPVDKEAPRGRLILPQVQALRDLLDSSCISMVVQDSELAAALDALCDPPALVVTDSQAFASVSEIVPASIPLTSFSVAFARLKGDLPTQVAGTLAIGSLTESSRVLIAEACTHHPIEEDIGTVKLPRLLRAQIGDGLAIDHVRGVDFPARKDLADYDLVIHCGACTFNRRMMMTRVNECVRAGVPLSNYGLTLAYLNGIFDRAVRAFPGGADLLDAGKTTGGAK